MRPPNPGVAKRQGRTRAARSAMFNPVSWLFVGVAIVLVVVLSYYLTLTTRPEISQIRPSPNSIQTPGPVQLGAIVTSQRSIDEIVFLVDDHPIDFQVDQISDQQWRVTYEDVFDRGEHRVSLTVTDRSGRQAQHDWSFEGSGDLTPPRVSLLSPPKGAVLPAGEAGLMLSGTTFANLESAEIYVNGEPASLVLDQPTVMQSEYSTGDDLPIYEWTISAEFLINDAQLSILAVLVDEFGAETSAEWEFSVTDSHEEATAEYFPETGQYAVEPFLSFWYEHNGEKVFGPPVSPRLQTDDGTEQQFYRFSRLELNDQGDVQITLIGRQVFGEPEPPPGSPPGPGSRLFDPTGHYIHGAIRDFWEENGGILIFGYPLSREFETSFGYAQYFERALIEVDETTFTPRVRLAPLGEQLYQDLAGVSPGN